MPPGVRTGAFPTIQDGYPCESGSPAAPILTFGSNQADLHPSRPSTRPGSSLSSLLIESYIISLIAPELSNINSRQRAS